MLHHHELFLPIHSAKHGEDTRQAHHDALPDVALKAGDFNSVAGAGGHLDAVGYFFEKALGFGLRLNTIA